MSVTAADGFVAVGGSAGSKAGGGPDVAVVATDDGVILSIGWVTNRTLSRL